MSENKPDLMAELAACPFCGGEAELFEGYGAFVVCAECEVEGPYKAFKDDAIAAWNKRTHHAELEAVVRDARGEREESWEVWQDDMCVAGSDSFADANHYLMMYGQDGPVKLVRVATYRETITPEQIAAMHNSAREG